MLLPLPFHLLPVFLKDKNFNTQNVFYRQQISFYLFTVSSADNTANSLKNDEPDVEKSFDVLVLSDVEADTGSFSLGDEEVTTGVAYDLIPPIDLNKSTAGVGSDDQEFPVLDTDNVFGTLSLDSSSFTKLSMSPVEKPSPCEDGSQSPVVLQGEFF